MKNKKIAIIGGGITGMSHYIYLRDVVGVPYSNIDIITEHVGGDFNSGGLKLLKYNENVAKFLNLVNCNFSIKKTNGAILINDEIKEYPSSIQITQDYDTQKAYWNKTRGDAPFDYRCMNDPWRDKKLDLNVSLDDGNIIDILRKKINPDKIHIQTLDIDGLCRIISNYDLVIYTIPIDLLFKACDIKNDEENKFQALTVKRYSIDKKVANKIWWDYLYIPYSSHPSHRLSISKNYDKNEFFIDYEFNSNKTSFYEADKKLLNIAFKNILNICGNFEFKLKGLFLIKGQMNNDLNKENLIKNIPKNVILSGRYAECDKRILWSDVINSLYKNKYYGNLNG